MKRRAVMTVLGCLLAAAWLGGGCAAPGPGELRLDRYRPDGAGRRPWEWGGARVEAGPSAAADGGEAVSPGSVRLRRGDQVVVYLRGIPQQEDVRDVVDDTGSITLPLLGNMTVEGKSTAEAELEIETAYVDGGFYRKINVIIVAQEGEYFVRGEVKREGRYPVSGDLTLLQAIAAAGGYTDFARRSRVKVIHDQQDMTFDADEIEKGRAPDPVIRNGDIIVVPRRLF